MLNLIQLRYVRTHVKRIKNISLLVSCVSKLWFNFSVEKWGQYGFYMGF